MLYGVTLALSVGFVGLAVSSILARLSSARLIKAYQRKSASQQELINALDNKANALEDLINAQKEVIERVEAFHAWKAGELTPPLT